MLEWIALIAVVVYATWLSFGKGKLKQQTKEQQAVLDDVKKTKQLRNSLRIKSVRDKLRNRFRK